MLLHAIKFYFFGYLFDAIHDKTEDSNFDGSLLDLPVGQTDLGIK